MGKNTNVILNVLKVIGYLLLILLILVVCGIISGIAICFIQTLLFVPKSYMLWTFNSPEKYLIFIVILIIDLFIYYLFIDRKLNRSKTPSLLARILRKCKVPIALFIIVLFYVLITSVTVFTNDKMIDRTFYHPTPTEYKYSDILSVKAGVYGNRIPWRQGQRPVLLYHHPERRQKN